MKILIASSEVFPFAKTGGLADVAGALPKRLRNLGHEVAVFLPAYQCIHQAGSPFRETGVDFKIPIGTSLVDGSLLQNRLPGSDVEVYAVENPEYFHREQLYGAAGHDYDDNCARFVFFCRGVLEAIRLLDWQPDLIHVNDWQTGLIPAFLKTELAGRPFYENIASLLTIHNLAYQGSFWHWDMMLTGLDWKYFNWKEMEFFGRLNLLKTGIVFADAINTVSPTYAVEIQTPDYGCGLDGVLRYRAEVLSGILNGIDDKEWNPSTDPNLVVNYDALSWQNGKAACKLSLQQERQLAPQTNNPLVGIIGRLASQKGWSLILSVMERWLAQTDVQWVILGTGQPEYERALSGLARKYPHKLSVELGFSNQLAHRIESAADLFVMPSLYEPCGLNQQYSLTYGTVPLVRRTGGLADTVVHADEESIGSRTANGFSFDPFTADALSNTLEYAVAIYQRRPDVWQQLVSTGMQRDWSWSTSAKKYERLYEFAIAQKRIVQSTV
jgi:starch synthase